MKRSYSQHVVFGFDQVLHGMDDPRIHTNHHQTKTIRATKSHEPKGTTFRVPVNFVLVRVISWIVLFTEHSIVMRFRFLSLLLLFLFLGSSSVQASLSKKQASKLISRMAGAAFPSGAVRVKKIIENDSEAEATAEIETAFRVAKNELSQWQVAEVRIGPDRWEEISLIALAAKLDVREGKCTAPDLNRAGGGFISAKRARCLVASFLRIELPSDAVRIRSVSSLGLPFASSSSALVVALLEVDFRFIRENGIWRISDLRTGGGDWISIDAALVALDAEKRKRAQQELKALAEALEAFRRDTGFYVSSEKHSALIDHLSPRYLSLIIRLDPWHNPYRYQGERDRFQIRSDGPDGKENTPDDLIVAGHGRQLI